MICSEFEITLNTIKNKHDSVAFCMENVTEVTQTKPTFKAWLKSVIYSILNLFIKYPLAMAVTIILIVGGTILALFGQKIQFGGLFSQLWGHKTETDPEAILHPPSGRVDDQGNQIPLGKPDDKGYVEPVVMPIKPPTIFSDSDTITVTKPDGKDTVLKLPTGVKNDDVKQIVMISDNVYQIKNNDSGVDTGKLLTELNK